MNTFLEERINIGTLVVRGEDDIIDLETEMKVI